MIPGEVKIRYRNWRGEVAVRHILPTGKIWHGTSPYHEGEQWFLEATDLGKGENRSFAMRDILEWDVKA